MDIRNPCVVSLTWRLEDAQGELIDELKEPMEFFFGGDDLLAKVEEALLGQSVGFEAALFLEPEHAFGDYHSELVFFEAADIFPDLLEEGMQFDGPPAGAQTPDMPADVIYTCGARWQPPAGWAGAQPEPASGRRARGRT